MGVKILIPVHRNAVGTDRSRGKVLDNQAKKSSNDQKSPEYIDRVGPNDDPTLGVAFNNLGRDRSAAATNPRTETKHRSRGHRKNQTSGSRHGKGKFVVDAES